MMKTLEEARAAIDAVDQEIVRLFEKRMTLCRDVAQYKIAHHMPVLDRSREEIVLASRMSMLKERRWAGDVRALYECIMACSRAEQERILREEGEDA